jgi:hypothetical protein
MKRLALASAALVGLLTAAQAASPGMIDGKFVDFSTSQLTVGTGTFGTLLPYTATPNLTGASLFAPAATANTNVPALGIYRTTQGYNGPSFNQSDETLFVGTHLNFTSPSAYYWGISNQVVVDHNAAPNGNGAYAEAMRSECNIASTIDQPMFCWGLGVIARGQSLTIPGYPVGIEVEVDKNVADAPAPSGLTPQAASYGYLASSGAYAPGNFINDAAFQVGNYQVSGGFQAGFSCAKEFAGATQNASISGTTLTLSTTSTAVAVGMQVIALGANPVTAGTKIVSGSGTTYTVNNSQTVALESMQITNPAVAWACMYAASRSPWAIDIGDGNWTAGQIRGKGWSVAADGGLVVSGSNSRGLDLRTSTSSQAQIQGSGFTLSTDGRVYSLQLNATGSLSSVSACGTSPAVTALSNSNGGQFTMGTGSPTACTITLGNAYFNAAFCTVTPASAYTGTYYISAQSNSAFTVTLSAGTSSVKFNYTCIGN